MTEAFEEVLRFAMEEVGCEVVIVSSSHPQILYLPSSAD